MKQRWYEIRNASGDEAEVYIYDEIGSWGITAKQFVDELQAVKAKTINLRVNSPGGDVFDAVAIYNALKHHPAAVHAVVDGIAASSASFITQAGDTVLMATGATMMIHEPSGMVMGDAGDMAKMAETLEKMGDTIASFYVGRAGGTEAEWRERMRAESWYRAQEAVDIKLADGLVDSRGTDRRVGIFNLSRFKNVPEWVKNQAGEASDLRDEAIPAHTTTKAPESDSWTALTLSDFTDESWDALSDAEKRRIATHFVWTGSGMPPERFSDLKGGHHNAALSGVGSVVWRAVSSGRMAQMPEYTDEGVRAHLARHYHQFGRTPPWEEEEDEEEDEATLDELTVALMPPLAEAAGYQGFTPSLSHLLSEHPLEVGG